MNIQERDILNILMEKRFKNQRELAELCGHSLGTVNRSLGGLAEAGYLDSEMKPTEKARSEAQMKAPKNAIILAAGFGMRMIPINMETPKGLLEVRGETLIERLIRQIQAVGVKKIYIVVGFMKEYYEYLIDEYGVELIVNSDYAGKNNLHSLDKVLDKISNSYVLPCDIWCAENPFHRQELYSWYMVSEQMSRESSVRVNRKRELTRVSEMELGNRMIGICYLLEKQAEMVRARIRRMCSDPRCDDMFWEETLYQKDRMIVHARVISADSIVEINTYEQLRELDSGSSQLKSDAIEVSAAALGVNADSIADIAALKKGMTNRSFLFRCRDKRYIMRIPGEGTAQLIDRAQEAAVYHVIASKRICDDIIYIDPENGYKITVYLEGARVCDPMKEEDVRKCMKKLRDFHEMELEVDHGFDIFGQIEFYQSLWGNSVSAYKDYESTKRNVFSLREFIDLHAGKKVLTHIDAVPDNFLFVADGRGEEEIRLIDWEYAGMQDPHVDIAMFCVYSMYDRAHVDGLIRAYFTEGCTDETRIKIYCYIAACGLLWSNWCEYKRSLGVEFGEYSLRQYRFAKDYYKIARDEMNRMEERRNA